MEATYAVWKNSLQ